MTTAQPMPTVDAPGRGAGLIDVAAARALRPVTVTCSARQCLPASAPSKPLAVTATSATTASTSPASRTSSASRGSPSVVGAGERSGHRVDRRHLERQRLGRHLLVRRRRGPARRGPATPGRATPGPARRGPATRGRRRAGRATPGAADGWSVSTWSSQHLVRTRCWSSASRWLTARLTRDGLSRSRLALHRCTRGRRRSAAAQRCPAPAHRAAHVAGARSRCSSPVSSSPRSRSYMSTIGRDAHSFASPRSRSSSGCSASSPTTSLSPASSAARLRLLASSPDPGEARVQPRAVVVRRRRRRRRVASRRWRAARQHRPWRLRCSAGRACHRRRRQSSPSPRSVICAAAAECCAAACRSACSAAANASFALVAIDVSCTRDWRGLWAVAVVAAVLVLAHRAHVALLRRHDALERLQRQFTRRIGSVICSSTPSSTRSLTGAPRAARGRARLGSELLGSKASRTRHGLRRRGRPRGRVRATAALAGDGQARPCATPSTAHRTAARRRGHDGRLISASAGSATSAGLRVGRRSTCSKTLAGHAASALHNGRLADQLRDAGLRERAPGDARLADRPAEPADVRPRPPTSDARAGSRPLARAAARPRPVQGGQRHPRPRRRRRSCSRDVGGGCARRAAGALHRAARRRRVRGAADRTPTQQAATALREAAREALLRPGSTSTASTVSVDASIGIALAPEHGDDV